LDSAAGESGGIFHMLFSSVQMVDMLVQHSGKQVYWQGQGMSAGVIVGISPGTCLAREGGQREGKGRDRQILGVGGTVTHGDLRWSVGEEAARKRGKIRRYIGCMYLPSPRYASLASSTLVCFLFKAQLKRHLYH
jgi:hypothetical protein